MKYKMCYEVVADNYVEEQFLLSRFPDSIWFITENNTRFYISKKYKNELVDAIGEWKERKKNDNTEN